MPGATVRLTMAQALVRYLCNQFTEIDGDRVPLFAGVFAVLVWVVGLVLSQVLPWSIRASRAADR